MKQRLAATFVIVIALCQGSPAQPKRIIRDDLSVRVLVNLTELPGDYLRFDYVFGNEGSSHQLMSAAIVELNDNWTEYGGSVRNVVPPREKYWGKFPTVGKRMAWVTYYDTTGLDVLERPPMSAVKPGERISFSFEAIGLPGVGHFWAEGWAKFMFTVEEEDSLIREGYTENSIRALDENFLTGFTVVRRPVPSPFNPLAFLDTLLSYAGQSAELGWLGRERDNDCDNDERPEDGIVRNIEQRLIKARRQLERRDSVLARRELEKLVGKVERLWKRSQDDDKKDKRDRWEKRDKVVITSEAYALLKYNTEYLIDRLLDESSRRPDRKPKKGFRDRD